MWLNDLVCINYKSCRNTHVSFSRDSANVLIGINDCGKSTLLGAIGLLFGSSKFRFHFANEFNRRSDFSNSPITSEEFLDIFTTLDLPCPTYSGNQTVILGKVIIEEPDKEDEKVELYSSILKWTVQHSNNDQIWIMSTFDFATNEGSTFILTKDVVENGEPLRLLNESQANLQAIVQAEDLQPVKKYERPGGFTKDELIEAICQAKDLAPVWILYDKASYRRDEYVYPIYQYLDWNISFSELENIAKIAVESKIENQVSEAKQFADECAAEAQEIVNAELAEFTQTLAEALPNIDAIKATVRFKLDTALTDIFVNKSNTDGDIHLDSQGDGVKRQIWFALLKWKAIHGAARNGLSKDHLWCFDEPETHLYPKAQRDFFEVLKKLASEEFQIIISTHSTVFVDRANFPDIKKFELHGAYTNVSKCTDAIGVYKALGIRNSDFLFFDKFLVVEGDTEEVLIPHMFELVQGVTLFERGIHLVKLGGKNKRNEHCTIFENMLKDFNKENDSVVYLLDNDARFGMTPHEVDKFCRYTVGKQDIEDSIPTEVWHDVVRDKFHEHEIEISIEEINGIYDEISDVQELQNNQKFYPRLKRLLKQKCDEENRHIVDTILPSKGRDLGNLLKPHITNKEQVSQRSQEAFEHLIRN